MQPIELRSASKTARQFRLPGTGALLGPRIVPDCPALGVHFKKASVVHAEDVPVGLMLNQKSSAAKQSSQPLLSDEGTPESRREH